MVIKRVWCMPNSRTFSIKPINELIHRYLNGGVVIDPFANDSKLGTITNDIDTSCNTTFHLEATEFLKQLDSECADAVLYDPPYNPRQVSECYKKFNMTVDMKTTQASYWTNQKKRDCPYTKTWWYLYHMHLEFERYRKTIRFRNHRDSHGSTRWLV